MHKIINYLIGEMDRLEEKIDRGGDLSRTDIECGRTEAHFLKCLLTSEAMLNSYSRDNNSYSRENNNSNGYSGRRDSMGRFADNGSYAYYDDRDMSNGYSGRQYSRDEGKSNMIRQFEMMRNNASQQEREVIDHALDQLRNM